MTHISVSVNEVEQCVDVKINEHVTPFAGNKLGVQQAFTFARLFALLMNPILSKKRLEKLNKDMGK
jgi:hypothetical protein